MLLKCISNIENAIYLITVKSKGITLYKKRILENEILTLNLKCCKCYTITACICNYCSSSCEFNIYTDYTNNNKYTIYFDKLPLYKITLTDKYYAGLPVMKGELTLCQ